MIQGMPGARAGRDPETFLGLIRRRRRGRFKVYLGYAPGVGKTYQMVLEGHRLRAQGVDVVIAFVESHGRPETRSLCLGLEAVPRRVVDYQGIRLEEMALEAVLARAPEVALVDELAHVNVPGGRHGRRWQDVLDLLEAGISVVTTVNVQHLERLCEAVERLVGVTVQERVPYRVLAETDQVVNVDLSVDDLQRRLRFSRVYSTEAVASSACLFRRENLLHLRELARRETAASWVPGSGDLPVATHAASGRVMVCLSSKGPDAAALLRCGSQLAGRFDRTWYAVYVQTPEEQPSRVDAAIRDQIHRTLELAYELGATTFSFRGDDVAATSRSPGSTR